MYAIQWLLDDAELFEVADVSLFFNANYNAYSNYYSFVIYTNNLFGRQSYYYISNFNYLLEFNKSDIVFIYIYTQEKYI